MAEVGPARVEKSAQEEVLQGVRRALEGLESGKVVVKVQGGKVIWVDRYDGKEQVG